MALLQERQERRDLDFKREINLSSTRDKTELAKDIAAMATTIGGYIVIGVDDNAFTPVGCLPALLDLISPEDILNKIGPFLTPEPEDVQFMRCQLGAQEFGVIYVPASTPIVHVFAKDGNYTPSETGRQKCAFAKGSIYVRHGPKSEIIAYKDLDRMLRAYAQADRRSLQEGLRKVVAAPIGSEVIIRGAGMELGTGPGAMPVRLTDDPSAPAVKGLLDPSQPESLDDLITVHLKAWKSSRDNIMSRSTLLNAYVSRDRLRIDGERLELMIYSSLLQNMPPFFWCSIADRGLVEAIVQRSFDDGRFPADKEAVRVAFLLGGTFGHGLVAAARRALRLDSRNFADQFGPLIDDPERHIALAKLYGSKPSIHAITPQDVDALTVLLNRALSRLMEGGDQSAKGTSRKLDVVVYGGAIVRRASVGDLPPTG